MPKSGGVVGVVGWARHVKRQRAVNTAGVVKLSPPPSSSRIKVICGGRDAAGPQFPPPPPNDGGIHRARLINVERKSKDDG